MAFLLLPLVFMAGSQLTPDDTNKVVVISSRPDPVENPKTNAAGPRAVQTRNNPAMWVTPRDYRHEWIIKNITGVVGFTLDVNTWGSVADCHITKSGGVKELDDATCELVAVRAQFFPALNQDGKAVAATYSSSVLWQIPEQDSGQKSGVPDEVSQEFAARSLKTPRINPFQNESERITKFSFDKEGKLIGCAQEGAMPAMPMPGIDMCSLMLKAGRPMIAPFVNESGEPIAKTVVITNTIRHSDDVVSVTPNNPPDAK